MRNAARTVHVAIALLVLDLLARGAPAQPPPSPASVPGVEAPTLPEVADPLLAPPPEAPRTIRSWNEALQVVRRQSPDYIANYESIARAEAQSRIALAAVLPVLSAQGSYTHQFLTSTITFNGIDTTVPVPNVWAAGAAASWSILNPRALYAVGTANRNTDATKLAFADRRRLIAQTIVNTMLGTLAQARIAELNRVGLRAALERLALTQGKLRYGQGTALDVDRAEQDVESARAQVVSGDESLRQSREALGIALGSNVAVGAPGDLDLEAFENAVATTCPLNDDIEKRPDVAAARVRLAVTERAKTDAWLQLSPTVTVQSQYQTLSQITFGSSFGPKTTWGVQAVLNVPLYDGGVRYGMLRDARAAAEQARQALILTRLNALVNVAQAQRSVSVFKASRDIAQRQRDLAATIDHRTREGYAHGLGTSLDLVTSGVALRQAEINLVLLQFQFAEARANAVLATASCVY